MDEKMSSPIDGPKQNRRPGNGRTPPARPSRAEAEAAVRTLIRWAGDDPDREGLVGTPARVVRAYEEWFAGNFENPQEYLQRTFEEVAGYDEIVLLRDIRFESHCEHHIAPIIGRVHIGYLPARPGGWNFQARTPGKRLRQSGSRFRRK